MIADSGAVLPVIGGGAMNEPDDIDGPCADGGVEGDTGDHGGMDAEDTIGEGTEEIQLAMLSPGGGGIESSAATMPSTGVAAPISSAVGAVSGAVLPSTGA